ncbi:MAG TPA: hypothetical protein VE462_03260 [Propionibacteriaceae bacterium]|jgi:tartronate-semialdehyde synthase|nr:hypothetical protein [Propionibacteriaceae bacterium]
MSRVTAADAVVKILELEGATQTFGLPGPAIKPLYAAVRGGDAPTAVLLD